MFDADANSGVPNEWWDDWDRYEEGPGDFNQPHRLVADAVVTLPLDSLGRLHDLEVLLSRAREAQASCALDLTTWRDLGALVHVIENDCRQLHARYMSDRTHLLTTANRMAAGIRARRRPPPRQADRQPPSTFPPYRRVPTGQTHDYLRHRAVTRGSRDRVRRYAVCAGYVTNRLRCCRRYPMFTQGPLLSINDGIYRIDTCVPMSRQITTPSTSPRTSGLRLLRQRSDNRRFGVPSHVSISDPDLILSTANSSSSVAAARSARRTRREYL